jgi:RNA polymerase sigma-70 factor (ECF subfamily)
MIAAGDEQALGTLFKAYRGRLFHYILNIVKSREAAEELVMDVFLKIWLARDVVTQIENIDAFIFRVACNKSIDFLRKASTDLKLSELLWDNIQLAGSNSPESLLIQQEYDTLLRKAINLMPPKRQEIYRLSREQGLTHAQIAEQLSISKNTVANQITEAQNFIKSLMLKNLDLAIVMLILLQQKNKN